MYSFLICSFGLTFCSAAYLFGTNVLQDNKKRFILRPNWNLEIQDGGVGHIGLTKFGYTICIRFIYAGFCSWEHIIFIFIVHNKIIVKCRDGHIAI